MSRLNIEQAQISNLTDKVDSWKIGAINLDSATGQKETEYINTKWSTYLGYYKKIPQLKKAIDGIATWTVGKGFQSDIETSIILDNINGWGEDTINSIFWTLLIVKKIGGDAFAEIIKDSDGNLINLKLLDPSKIKIIVNENGIIKRYEQINKIGEEDRLVTTFKPNEILHLCNERIADEIHGTSIIEACEETIKMLQEAMTDWKTVLHRNVNPLKLIKVDTEDQTKIDELQTKYEKMINLKEVMFIPKDTVEVEVVNTSLQDSMTWINYLEKFFYQAVGVPKVILGGSEEFTESSSKIAYVTFEQIYTREQREFEADLWNQLQVKVKFNKPLSLRNELLTDEKKDNNNLNMQASDMTLGMMEE